MRRLMTTLGLLAALALPRLALAQPHGYPAPPQVHAVVCESHDGAVRECATGFRGPAVLMENLSSTPCVEGRNWGNTGRGTVWVQAGCRASFAAAQARMWGDGGGGWGSGAGGWGGGGGGGWGGQGPALRCESDDNRYRECRVPARARVELSRQLSDAPCIEGRSWGQRGGGRLWVDRGCRGEFVVAGPAGGGWGGSGGAWSGGGGWGGSVVCASEDMRTHICPWDGRMGRPVLLEQMSDSPCQEGHSWGLTRRGEIWVSRGCRGRFGVR